MHAVNKGYPLLVEPLLAAGADPDVRAPDGATALFMAAAHGHTEVVTLLMEADADASIRGPKGKTAADVAQLHQDPAVAAAMGFRDAFRDCHDCPELVVVPAGRFMRGSPLVQEVTIAEPFAVGVYEVTFDEWDACRRGRGCSHNPNDLGRGRGRRPVTDVSWGDAQEYARWLSRETGKQYRLLSESEWEYVARAGTATLYWWGDSIGSNRASCDGCGSRWDDEQAAPVGSFPANPFGLHDVHGNVWEWVEDCWHSGYVGAPSNGNAWTSGGDCGRRVVRGGSFYHLPENLHSSFRSRRTSSIRHFSLGFRVARTLTP